MAKAPAKENQFDERRETLVVEKKTSWPADVKAPESDRPRLADALHANRQNVKKLEYIRCPTGFIRHITVTQEDLDAIKT